MKEDMKFKVGDRVKIKDLDEKVTGINNIYNLANKICTINFVDDENDHIFLDEITSFIFYKDWIEPVSNKSIYITTDGKTTYAVLKDGKEVIKQERTDCHPMDEFNFEYGAKKAFKMLMGEDIEKEVKYREVKRKAKIGEKVKIVNATDVVHDICGNLEYKNGDILTIIECQSGMNNVFYKKSGGSFLYEKEYVVLEPINEELKVGDIVKVVDFGKAYSKRYDWFGTNNISIDIASRYAYDIYAIDKEASYEILHIGDADDTYNGKILTIQEAHTYCQSVYLIGTKGVERA